MEGLDIVTTVTALANSAKTQLLDVAPYLIGVMATFAGVNIGIKIFKRIISKVG